MTNAGGKLKDRAAEQAAPQGTEPGTAVAEVPREERVAGWLAQQKHVIDGALPTTMTAEKLLRVVATVVRQNPELMNCTPASLLGAVITSTQLGLEPGPQGLCFFIPRTISRKGQSGEWHKVKEVVWQLGYKGVIELASRSGRVSAPIARTVYEGDLFEWEYGLDEKLRHVPSPDNDRTQPVYWYAMAKDVRTGQSSFVVIDRRDVEEARAKSSSPNSPLWKDHYDQAGRKTAILRLRHWLPQSPELAVAVTLLDGRVRHDVRKGVMDLGTEDVWDVPAEDIEEVATPGEEQPQEQPRTEPAPPAPPPVAEPVREQEPAPPAAVPESDEEREQAAYAASQESLRRRADEIAARRAKS